MNNIEEGENLNDFQKSYSYGNDEHKMITSQAFPCWSILYVMSNMSLESERFLYPWKKKKIISMHLD